MELKRLPLLVLFTLFCFFDAESQHIGLPSQTIGTLAPININFNGASGVESSWIGLYPVSGNDASYITFQYINDQISGELVFGGIQDTGYFNFRMFSGNGYDKIYTSDPVLIKRGMYNDASFADNGVYRTDFCQNNLDDWAADARIDTDGKIVVAGASKTGQISSSGIETIYIIVARFDANGQPDLSFGQNGKVITAVSASNASQVSALVVQPDNKIIVGGSAFIDEGPCLSTSSFLLVRYLPNGIIDTGFGENGFLITNFTWPSEPAGFSSDYLNSLALQPDGKILAGGYGYLCGSGWGLPSRCNLSRYLADGTPDPGFGEGGKLTFYTSEVNYPENYRERVDAIATPVQVPGGSIYCSVTAGDGNMIANKQFIYKFDLNGVIDPAFGLDGVVVDDRPGLENDQYSRSIAIGPDNYLYTMGCTSGAGEIWLMKKDPVTGQAVPDFGDNGMVLKGIGLGCVPGGFTFFNDQIYVGHSTSLTSWSVSRYNLDGTEDISIGTPIFELFYNDTPVESNVNAILVQADGKVVLAGSSFFPGITERDLTVVRFIENEDQFQINSHVLQLKQGWNSISSYLTPANNDPAAVMSPVGDELIILQDMSGMYYPQQELNTLYYWNYASGYTIKVNGDTQLSVNGFDPPQKTIILSPGWNLIPVLSETDTEIEVLFGENIGLVECIKDAVGSNVFWPEKGVISMQSLIPGKAYLVKMFDQATIDFN